MEKCSPTYEYLYYNTGKSSVCMSVCEQTSLNEHVENLVLLHLNVVQQELVRTPQ